MMRILYLLGILLSPLHAAPPILFGGYLARADDTRFVLIDPTSKTSSDLLKVGASFQGHVILGFDRATETLLVRQFDSDQVLRLSLVGSTVKDSHWFQTGTLLSMQIEPSGAILKNGREIPVESLEEMFRNAANNGWLHLRVNYSLSGDADRVRRTILAIKRAFRSCGVLGRFTLESPSG